MAEENAHELEQEQADVQSTPAESVMGRTVELRLATASIIHAEKDVNIRLGGAREIRAQEVTIRQGGALSIDADKVDVVQGCAGIVRSGDAHLGPGSQSMAVVADTVRLEQSGVQFLLARDSADLDQSGVGILVGQHITAKDSAALLMFADSVEGDVNVVMDRQMAITFGAALGAALGLVLSIFGILRRRK